MDVYCPKCGEPWEHDSLHEEASARYGIGYGEDGYDSEKYGVVFGIVSREFRSIGCGAMFSFHGKCNPEPSTRTDPVFGLTSQEAAGALYDILGDDMDGAAAMLEDMGF